MIIFAHLHKAAGTSVVNAAIKSGFRLPERHANGHPVDDRGRNILLDRMEKTDVDAFFSRLHERDVRFVAIEWGFPRFEYLSDIEDLQLVTILRDPVDRAISNYRMDIVYQYAGGNVFGFDSYTRESVLHCANNYYVRFFCGLSPTDSIDMDHYEYAKKLLAEHFRVVVLGKDELDTSFSQFGFKKSAFSHDNRLHGSGEYLDYRGVRALRVKDEDIIKFIACNSYDIALFRLFARGGQID